MAEQENEQRLQSEFVTLSAVRGTLHLATSIQRNGTYDAALELGGRLVPSLLGDDVSLIKKSHTSEEAKEYKQLAEAQSADEGIQVSALGLVTADIAKYDRLLKKREGQQKTDKLKSKLKALKKIQRELSPQSHYEGQLIMRDAFNATRPIPTIDKGNGYITFEMPNKKALRIRAFHPDRPEHISGADLLYEKFHADTDTATVALVQYKIMDDKKISLSNPDLIRQLKRLENFVCKQGLCKLPDPRSEFRMPHCAAFLRPTDKLQNPDQRLMSTGEHIPVCRIKKFIRDAGTGPKVMHMDDVRKLSVSHEVFEELFVRDKLGSRELSFAELEDLWEKLEIRDGMDTVFIHAQEYPTS